MAKYESSDRLNYLSSKGLLKAIALIIYLLKAIAITVSRDFYAIALTIYLLKVNAIPVSRDY